MRLRPHHLLDIVSKYGHGLSFEPHPYGHAVHLVAKAILANPDREVRFVVAADDICDPCKHLQSNRRADWKVVSRFINIGRLLPLGAYPSGTATGNTG